MSDATSAELWARLESMLDHFNIDLDNLLATLQSRMENMEVLLSSDPVYSEDGRTVLVARELWEAASDA